ncbi:MAG: polysaccharide deacetylase family protein [Bacilli bacterium]|nr:polysaccharide deacetylase family protein [Bacilli bacterium]
MKKWLLLLLLLLPLNVKAKDSVSIMYYKNIGNCETETCTSESLFNMQLMYLKSMNYETITLEDFLKWQNNEKEINDKSVLIIVENKSENLDNILKTYNYQINYFENFDVRYIDFNKAATKDDTADNEPIYLIKDNMLADKYKEIIDGKSFAEEFDYSETATKVPVLNYHFLNCNEIICLSPEMFEQHLIYMKENGYKTLTVQEFIDWKEGKIDLPKKSVLITFDDGGAGTSRINGNYLIPLLEKYDMHATLFLITSFWDIHDYISPNLEIESHTDAIHDGGACTYKARYMSVEEIKADMQKSIDIVNSHKIFAYPCYYYNDNFIEALKELGFKEAFIGENVSVRRGNNDFLLPRKVIIDSTNVDDLKYYLEVN